MKKAPHGSATPSLPHLSGLPTVSASLAGGGSSVLCCGIQPQSSGREAPELPRTVWGLSSLEPAMLPRVWYVGALREGFSLSLAHRSPLLLLSIPPSKPLTTVLQLLLSLWSLRLGLDQPMEHLLSCPAHNTLWSSHTPLSLPSSGQCVCSAYWETPPGVGMGVGMVVKLVFVGNSGTLGKGDANQTDNWG